MRVCCVVVRACCVVVFVWSGVCCYVRFVCVRFVCVVCRVGCGACVCVFHVVVFMLWLLLLLLVVEFLPSALPSLAPAGLPRPLCVHSPAAFALLRSVLVPPPARFPGIWLMMAATVCKCDVALCS